MLQNISVKHLFATPLIISELPPEVVATLNPQLEALVLAKAAEGSGVANSNQGGWQSDDRLPDWGGSAIEQLLTAIKALLQQVTLVLDGGEFQRSAVEWRINGWANINRLGHGNLAHTHPGAFWSAVYYVAVDGKDHPGHEGDIEFLDPRGPLPVMYCPQLHMGLQGYTTAGKSEFHRPQAGQIICFPSWLTHAVRGYKGDGARISLAFNFSL
jgi:uncharacterized protein (TIGR02466 family)